MSDKWLLVIVAVTPTVLVVGIMLVAAFMGRGQDIMNRFKRQQEYLEAHSRATNQQTIERKVE